MFSPRIMRDIFRKANDTSIIAKNRDCFIREIILYASSIIIEYHNFPPLDID